MGGEGNMTATCRSHARSVGGFVSLRKSVGWDGNRHESDLLGIYGDIFRNGQYRTRWFWF